MTQLPRVCTNCGAIVPDGHHFCGRCGTPYEEESNQANQTVYYSTMQAPGRAKLILIAGDAIEGMSYHLNATHHQCGRMAGLIPFDDPFISENHADFYYDDSHLYLADQGSTNGTYIRIKGKAPLADGAMLRAGAKVFKLEMLQAEKHVYEDGTQFYSSPPREVRFRLVEIIEGGLPGLAYASPNHEVAIGREGCDLSFPDDVYLNHRHFKVFEEDGQVFVQDFDSLNGTFLRLQDPIQVVHGDYVFIGHQLLRVEIPV